MLEPIIDLTQTYLDEGLLFESIEECMDYFTPSLEELKVITANLEKLLIKSIQEMNALGIQVDTVEAWNLNYKSLSRFVYLYFELSTCGIDDGMVDPEVYEHFLDTVTNTLENTIRNIEAWRFLMQGLLDEASVTIYDIQR